uniref:lysoplasmalogenase n=1 Tax=Myripristis murdjan TaxID=586833 RepID=A0A667Y5N5_9TELE
SPLRFQMIKQEFPSCALCLSLVPFFLATAAFFYTRTPDFAPSAVAAGVKAAPTLLLAFLVLSWKGGQSVLGVAGGLVSSAVGDICLVWSELFLHGMGAFAVAHLLYAFSFLSARYSPLSSSSCWIRFLYVLLFVMGGGSYVYLYPYIQKAPDAAVLTPAVGVYVALITLMVALAVRTRRAATLLGGLSFMVSDLTLALQIFKVMPSLEHGYTIVMITYYLAQLLIAVGDIKAVENEDDFAKWKRS